MINASSTAVLIANPFSVVQHRRAVAYCDKQAKAAAKPVAAIADPYAAFLAQGGKVKKCRPSLRGLNRAVAVRVRPTRVVKSRG
jgi:hypothetical protein